MGSSAAGVCDLRESRADEPWVAPARQYQSLDTEPSRHHRRPFGHGVRSTTSHEVLHPSSVLTIRVR